MGYGPRLRATAAAAALMLAPLGGVALAAAPNPPSDAAQPVAPPATPMPSQQQLEQLAATLKPATGTVRLAGTEAQLVLPEGLGFLDASQSRTLIAQIWGNPPEAAEGVLGTIIDTRDDILAPESWGAVVTWHPEGWVSDADAADLDADSILAELQEGARVSNEARRAAGYPALDVVGWAEPPHYDAQSKRILWGRRLHADDGQEDTLNYDIRVLGRHGYVAISFVAPLSQLEAVRADAPGVLQAVQFDAGARYADHQATDAVSGYGLAGLITGAAAAGAAKKAGLFGLLLAFGKKGIGVLLLVLAGLGGWLRRLFSGARTEP